MGTRPRPKKKPKPPPQKPLKLPSLVKSLKRRRATIDETIDPDGNHEVTNSHDEASDLRTTTKTKTVKTTKTNVNSTSETTTDHHEPTTDEGATIENPVTQGLATGPATRAKNEAAEANSTLVTKLKTQKKSPKKPPQNRSPTITSKTKTQKPRTLKKRLLHKSHKRSNSLSKSTWLPCPATAPNQQKQLERPTMATTS